MGAELIDHNIVKTFNSAHRVVVISDLGTGLRESMVHWATHDPMGSWVKGVYIAPSTLHRTIYESLNRQKVNGEPPPIHLISSHKVRFGNLPSAKRVAIETQTYGKAVQKYLSAIVPQKNVSIVFRFMPHLHRMNQLQELAGMGFQLVRYQLSFNVRGDFEPQITMMDRAQINAK